MLTSQYLRLENNAGGVTCTNRQFIKSCYTVLAHDAKGRDKRTLRHAWLRSGLVQLNRSRDLYYSI